MACLFKHKSSKSYGMDLRRKKTEKEASFPASAKQNSFIQRGLTEGNVTGRKEGLRFQSQQSAFKLEKLDLNRYS